MNTIEITLCVFGFIHGYVAWILSICLVGPVAKIILPVHSERLPISNAISHIFSLLFMVAILFMTMREMILFLVESPSRHQMGMFFWSAFFGFACSGIIPRVEARFRRKS